MAYSGLGEAYHEPDATEFRIRGREFRDGRRLPGPRFAGRPDELLAPHSGISGRGGAHMHRGGTESRGPE